MFVSHYYLLGLNTPTMSLTAWYSMFLICDGRKTPKLIPQHTSNGENVVYHVHVAKQQQIAKRQAKHTGTH